MNEVPQPQVDFAFGLTNVSEASMPQNDSPNCDAGDTRTTLSIPDTLPKASRASSRSL